ncbi:hypothetical protein [Streptomyces sp. NPDC051567]|uniref:hypothetical protein n=1 Tax=Streptomyces sp. NPDC051567 TaxID=3365660 RepID=UPI003789518F
MRRITASLVAPAAALLLLATAPTVSAAPGEVVQRSRSGEEEVTDDPKPSDCHQGLGKGTTISNFTESPILLFPDPNCRTKIFDPLEPEETRTDWAGGSFRAVN